ncbi:MAG: hypothetical protein ACTSVV_14330, partial [Promethearchaeota archaeon]
GFLNPDLSIFYTPGFIYYNATAMSLTDNYYILYYYLKYCPYYFTIIDIFTLFYIYRLVFKEKIYIFISLFLFLGLNYYFYRHTQAFPSILATSLGFIAIFYLISLSKKFEIYFDKSLILILKSGIRDNKIWIFAIILGGIIMAHPLNGFFYTLFFFIFMMFLFFKLLLEKLNIDYRIKSKLIKFYLVQLILGIFIIIFIIEILHSILIIKIHILIFFIYLEILFFISIILIKKWIFNQKITRYMKILTIQIIITFIYSLILIYFTPKEFLLFSTLLFLLTEITFFFIFSYKNLKLFKNAFRLNFRFIFYQLLIFFILFLYLLSFFIYFYIRTGNNYISYMLNRFMPISPILNFNYFFLISEFFRSLATFLMNSPLFLEVDNFFGAPKFFNLLHSAEGFYTHIHYFTFSLGSFLFIIGLFINFKKFYKTDKAKNYLISFSKLSMILLFVIFSINLFLTPSIIVHQTKRYMNFLIPRLFELYSGLWIIIFTLLIKYSINFFKIILTKIKYFKIKNSYNFKHILYSFYLLFIISLATFFYITNFERIFLDYRDKLNDYQCDCLLYAGNYFYNNDNISNTGIFIQVTHIRFTFLIFNPKIEIYSYNFSKDLLYSKFEIDFLINNSKYVIFNLSKINNNFKENFIKNFQIIYINQGNYTFAKYLF